LSKHPFIYFHRTFSTVDRKQRVMF